MIEQFGKDDFYVRILHKFPSEPEKAILKEAEYFKYIKKQQEKQSFETFLNDNPIYKRGTVNGKSKEN